MRHQPPANIAKGASAKPNSGHNSCTSETGTHRSVKERHCPPVHGGHFFIEWMDIFLPNGDQGTSTGIPACSMRKPMVSNRCSRGLIL